MDTQKYTTMIVGFAIAIVLVTGLMVPVISSLGSGGGGDGGSTYVNEGTYYKSPTEGENHTITLTDTEDYENHSGVVTVDYDGTTIITETYETLEMTTESPDPVIIPILFGSGTMEVQPGVEATQNYGYILYIGYMPYMDEYDYSIYGMRGFATLISYTEVIVGGQTVQSMANGGSIPEPYDITIEGDTFTTPEFGGHMIPGVQIHICDEGDLVYADNPVFSADSNVMMAYSGYVYRYENPTDWDEYGLYATYEGKIDEMDVDNLTYIYISDSSSIASLSDPVIATSDYSGALKLDSITMTALFEDDSERTFTAKSLIVPKEVQIDGSGSGSEISPTLVSLISVIPLITVIGIVIGTVGYLRMKN